MEEEKHCELVKDLPQFYDPSLFDAQQVVTNPFSTNEANWFEGDSKVSWIAGWYRFFMGKFAGSIDPSESWVNISDILVRKSVENLVGHFKYRILHSTDPIFHRDQEIWEARTVLRQCNWREVDTQPQKYDSEIEFIHFICVRILSKYLKTIRGIDLTKVIEEELDITSWDERICINLFSNGAGKKWFKKNATDLKFLLWQNLHGDKPATKYVASAICQLREKHYMPRKNWTADHRKMLSDFLGADIGVSTMQEWLSKRKNIYTLNMGELLEE